ncbi:MAG: protein-L-isoaspartate O-methyltransferase [Methyloversatilis sp.]|jgi:protein-L-isoaspartate(D-aspartate) O-methyltransferase|nr:protein-L-isoaspartate O-methyltransferase [Methyloversatilis sp.]MBP6193603.1 protein-L-isoaspartate O-methyltransferase [Methyloversatilis sp.]MBP9118560.1 protein-L-isoaspartate O-methyltransferase [Methyloversatilis sp.]
MDIEQARFNMVEQQIRPWDVLDQDILDLLFVVRRENFVPAALRDLAFVDTAIPLGHGAAMLEPKIEARVLQELHVRTTDTVLEIGTGSGYMAALLGARASQVTTVEIEPDLAARARENLVAVGALNVRVEVGDASQGWPVHAPYDVIVVSGGLPVLPQELVAQLRPGGRLIAFIGAEPLMNATLVTLHADGSQTEEIIFETLLPTLRNARGAQRFVF